MKKLKRGSKSINNKALSCQYCYYWRTLPERDQKTGRRFCIVKEDWIKATTTACDQYKIGKFFWCQMESKFQTLNACESRRAGKEFKNIQCWKCTTQAVEVDNVIEFAKSGVKEKLDTTTDREIKKIKRIKKRRVKNEEATAKPTSSNRRKLQRIPR